MTDSKLFTIAVFLIALLFGGVTLGISAFDPGGGAFTAEPGDPLVSRSTVQQPGGGRANVNVSCAPGYTLLPESGVPVRFVNVYYEVFREDGSKLAVGSELMHVPVMSSDRIEPVSYGGFRLAIEPKPGLSWLDVQSESDLKIDSTFK